MLSDKFLQISNKFLSALNDVEQNIQITNSSNMDSESRNRVNPPLNGCGQYTKGLRWSK